MFATFLTSLSVWIKERIYIQRGKQLILVLPDIFFGVSFLGGWDQDNTLPIVSIHRRTFSLLVGPFHHLLRTLVLQLYTSPSPFNTCRPAIGKMSNTDPSLPKDFDGLGGE